MSNKFTDSEKFRNPWYRKLSLKHKCLWEYLLAECSWAGILEIDLDSASFHIGAKITDDDLKEFQNKLYYISENIVFISSFLMFQQPNGLNSSNNAHKGIIKELEKYNIPLEYEKIKELVSPSLGAKEELASSPVVSSNSKGKGNGIVKPKIEKKEKDFDFIEDPEWKNLFSEWIEYKKSQFKFEYKSAKSLKTAYDELISLSNNELTIAKQIVGRTIANGWKGLFPLKEGGGQKSPPPSKTQDTKEAILNFIRSGKDVK